MVFIKNNNEHCHDPLDIERTYVCVLTWDICTSLQTCLDKCFSCFAHLLIIHPSLWTKSCLLFHNLVETELFAFLLITEVCKDLYHRNPSE